MPQMADLSDKQLADMVRKGCYAQRTEFAPGKSRFLLVLAVPYGDEDDVHTLKQAYDAFAELVGGEGSEVWDETNIQVFDSQALPAEQFFELAAENLCDTCGGSILDEDGYDGDCASCADKKETAEDDEEDGDKDDEGEEDEGATFCAAGITCFQKPEPGSDYCISHLHLEEVEVKECDCHTRSWYGDEHDTACPLAGEPMNLRREVSAPCEIGE